MDYTHTATPSFSKEHSEHIRGCSLTSHSTPTPTTTNLVHCRHLPTYQYCGTERGIGIQKNISSQDKVVQSACGNTGIRYTDLHNPIHSLPAAYPAI